MEEKLKKIVTKIKKCFNWSMVISGFVGALIAWAVGLVLPMRPVEANNIPKKELTCTLDFFLSMVSQNVIDNKLQMLYDGEAVGKPYLYSITVTNTGDYAVTNEDFNIPFSIEFQGAERIVYGWTAQATNQLVIEEIAEKASINGTYFIIEDFFLNPGESFTVHLISDGKPKTIIYNSRINDIGQLVIKSAIEEKRNSIRKVGIYTAIGIVGSFLLLLAVIWTSIKMSEKKQREELKKILEGMNNHPNQETEELDTV